MPPTKALDRGTAAAQRGVTSEAASSAVESRLRTILNAPVPAGSSQRRDALTSFVMPLPMTEKARLLTELSNPRDPLGVLLRERVHPSTVVTLVELLQVGSGRQTALPVAERMTSDALKGEFLGIVEAPLSPSRTETSREEAYLQERSGELADELGRRGEAYSTPDPTTQRDMDLDLQLHDATQRFDYGGVDVDDLISTFERPGVDLLGGLSKGYARTLQVSGGQLFPVGEGILHADAPSVVSAHEPETIVPPYLDVKRMVLAIRFPVEVRLKSGEAKSYVFEIFWFAADRSEFNYLRGHAESAAEFNPSDEMRHMVGGELQRWLRVKLGILMRPLVGDAVLYGQMKADALHMVVSTAVNAAADVAAAKITGGGGGGGSRGRAGGDGQLKGAAPAVVAKALADPSLFKIFRRSQGSGARGEKAAAKLDTLADAIAEHAHPGPRGSVKLDPTVASAVWALPENLRGVMIERTLARTQYKDWVNVGQQDRGFFPDIDFGRTPTSGPQERVSVKTVSPFAKGYLKQVGETLPAHVGSLVEGTLNLRRAGDAVTTTLDVRMPAGSSVPARDLAATLRDLIPREARPYVKVVVGEF